MDLYCTGEFEQTPFAPIGAAFPIGKITYNRDRVEESLSCSSLKL
jgi:hypothetical protein